MIKSDRARAFLGGWYPYSTHSFMSSGKRRGTGYESRDAYKYVALRKPRMLYYVVLYFFVTIGDMYQEITWLNKQA